VTRGEDGEVVFRGEVTVEYEIRAWSQGDGEDDMYDWLADSGEESGSLFQTLAEAKRDAVLTLGG
jgi:hypothetical protein